MKRIKCKACGRPRWARPLAGQYKDRLTEATLADGRKVRVSDLKAKQENCLPCREATQAYERRKK